MGTIVCANFDISEDERMYYTIPSGEITKTNMEFIGDVFSNIYEIVEKSDFEFAYRTVKEIRSYIAVAYELAEQQEFDLIK